MTEAETAAFKAGYLLACCNLVHLHKEPDIASDVLAEAGITKADVKAMDLTEYDRKVLREIRKARRLDPLT
jgi:hypothetical protein